MKIDIASDDRRGRTRRSLWQCKNDLSWQPNLEEWCRKCGKHRETVGISPEPYNLVLDRTEQTGEVNR